MDTKEEEKVVSEEQIDLANLSKEEEKEVAKYFSDEQLLIKLINDFDSKVSQGNSYEPPKRAGLTKDTFAGFLSNRKNPEKIREQILRLSKKYNVLYNDNFKNFYIKNAEDWQEKRKANDQNTWRNIWTLKKKENKARTEALKVGKKLAKLGVQLTVLQAQENGKTVREVAEAAKLNPRALKVPLRARGIVGKLRSKWYISHVFRNEVYAAAGITPRMPFVGMNSKLNPFFYLPLRAKYKITSADPVAFARLAHWQLVLPYGISDEKKAEVAKWVVSDFRKQNAAIERQKKEIEALEAKKTEDTKEEEKKASPDKKVEVDKNSSKESKIKDEKIADTKKTTESVAPKVYGKYENPYMNGKYPEQQVGQPIVTQTNQYAPVQYVQGAKYMDGVEPKSITDALIKGLPIPAPTIEYQPNVKNRFDEQKAIYEFGRLLQTLSMISSTPIGQELHGRLERYTNNIRTELYNLIGVNFTPSPQAIIPNNIVYQNPNHQALEREYNDYWNSEHQIKINQYLNLQMQKAAAYDMMQNVQQQQPVVPSLGLGAVMSSVPTAQIPATLMDMVYSGPIASSNQNVFNTRFMSWNEMRSIPQIDINADQSNMFKSNYEANIFSQPVTKTETKYQTLSPISNTIGIRYTDQYFDRLLNSDIRKIENVSTTSNFDGSMTHTQSVETSQRVYQYGVPDLSYRYHRVAMPNRLNMGPHMYEGFKSAAASFMNYGMTSQQVLGPNSSVLIKMK